MIGTDIREWSEGTRTSKALERLRSSAEKAFRSAEAGTFRYNIFSKDFFYCHTNVSKKKLGSGKSKNHKFTNSLMKN